MIKLIKKLFRPRLKLIHNNYCKYSVNLSTDRIGYDYYEFITDCGFEWADYCCQLYKLYSDFCQKIIKLDEFQEKVRYFLNYVDINYCNKCGGRIILDDNERFANNLKLLD